MRAPSSIRFFIITMLIAPFAAATGETTVPDTGFVGSTACAACHTEQYRQWQGSHHERAMDHATPDSVRGNFNNQRVNHKGKTSRFFTKDKRYWASLEGADGKFRDYPIAYTFGWEPLQQYMVALDDGRIQLIPFAWDTRPEVDGGQRWFYLHPEHDQPHHDFYWLNPGQNWNYMCADCHSTQVDKGYSPETGRYNTTYEEISVGCEACHGPGRNHIQWAGRAASEPEAQSTPAKGFNRHMGKAVQQWLLQGQASTASPVGRSDTDQTLVCAQCHSRHIQISDTDYVDTGHFGDRYLLNLIDAERYYPTGQVYDENYVYGSFLQSKMAGKGVVCSNCHNPHSAKLVLPQETVCLQCHQAETYATKSHHHHPEDSAGAQCVSCHMPETTYMQVDARREHQWHKPRSDYSQRLNTPDTCLGCHQDKDSHWSKTRIDDWYPGSQVMDEMQFAPVFAAADQGYQGVETALSHIAQNTAQPAIIRASALARLNNSSHANGLIANARGTKNDNEIIRLGAVRGSANLPLAERWRLLSPLLQDPVLGIRTEAASALAPLWPSLSQPQQAQLQIALDEYNRVQSFNADRGFSHLNRGNVLMHQGKIEAAQRAYRESIRVEPTFDAAYLYLADTYRALGNEDEVLKQLLSGQKANPDNSEFAYQMGLRAIRLQDSASALTHFQQAIRIEPENSQNHYLYALTLESSDPAAAARALTTAYDLSNNPQHLYAECEIRLRHRLAETDPCLGRLSSRTSPQVAEQLRNRYR